jgi:hypothetical protein
MLEGDGILVLVDVLRPLLTVASLLLLERPAVETFGELEYTIPPVWIGPGLVEDFYLIPLLPAEVEVYSAFRLFIVEAPLCDE